MRKIKQNSWSVKEIFMGMDVHKRFWVISVISGGEYILRSVRIPGAIEALERLLRRYSHLARHRVHLVYEAGCFGFWLCHALEKRGYDCMVTSPSLIPMEVGNKVKTDKRDSQKLALYLYKGLLKPVYVLGEEDVARRELCRTRGQLVCHRQDIERQIKAKLLVVGILLELQKGKWTGVTVRRIQAAVQGTGLEIPVGVMLEIRSELEERIGRLGEEVRAVSELPEYAESVQLLDSIPGIGILTATSILLELGNNVARFGNERQFCAYLGLTPAEYSSGDRIHRGEITQSGNKRVRCLLTESSWQLIRKDRQLREWYEGIKLRRGGKRAIVAVARRLACRIRHLLLHQEPYRIAA